jgi:hypothetical protein
MKNYNGPDMRRDIPYEVVLWIVLLLLSVNIAIGQSAGTVSNSNLVYNPGFEDGDVPWKLDNWMGNEVANALDDQNPHSGQWSMKVQLLKVLNGPMLMLAYPHLLVRPGSAIRVKFWARGVSNGANLTVMVRREIEPRISYLRTEMYLTDEWQQYAYTIQLPADANPDATSLRFVLNQPGVFWVDDVFVVELPPMDEGPAPEVNPVRNPSFEVGTDGWTGMFRKREFGTLSQESGTGVPAPDNARLNIKSDGTAPDGERFLSVKIEEKSRNILTSAYFPARYGHKGQLRFFLRSDSARAFEVGVGGGINAGTSLQSQTKKASTQWQQFTVPVTLRPAQDGVYFIDFRFSEPGVYDMDAVSFVEEELANVPLYPPSVAIQAVQDGPVANLYAPAARAGFKLVQAGEKPGATARYEITVLDYLERKVTGFTVNMACDQRGYGEQLVEVPTRLFGTFRIEASHEGSEGALAEQIYSVLPSLPSPGDRRDSYFGGHVDLTPYNLEIARKAGFRWLRMWPPLATTWIAAEPTPGTWNFQADAIKRAYGQGFNITGILGTAPDFKADLNSKSAVTNRWSHSYPPNKINDWKEYVAKCTQAFYPYITTWEVWNEADGGYLQVRPGVKKDSVYLALLKAAREVIDSAGKQLTLMGPAVASINAPLGWDVLKQGGGQWMDAFSFHFYSLAAGGSNPDDPFALSVLKKLRTYKNKAGETMPLWHTEGGMYLQGGHSWLNTYRMPVSSPAKKQNAAAAMVRAALLFKSMGVKHYFDFELSASATGREVNGDMTAGFIEVTGIPGPGIAAHAAMVALTEDAAPAGFENRAQGSARLKVAHFQNDSVTIDVYWSDLPVALKKAVKMQPGDKVLDMMGNPVPVEETQTGEFPLYVIRTRKK